MIYMPKTTFVGHALHPQLINMPMALLPFSFALDLMHLATGKRSYAEAAYYSMVGGYLGGVAAASAGAGPRRSAPRQSRSPQWARRVCWSRHGTADTWSTVTGCA